MLFGLFGCDYLAEKKLKPGESTVQEVERLMGEPTMRWDEPDGTRLLEYSRMPNGTHNYMLRISSAGILVSMEQTLDEAHFDRVATGMTEDQVRRLLGQPATRQPLPLKNQLVWDWPYVGPANQEMRFNVHFGPEGKVVETSRTMVQTSG
ncbi:MAG: outer membrane protein assembly factor BamE [Rhodocyclaceae bacterium]